MRRWLPCVIAGASLLAAAGCGHLNDYLEISRDKGMSGEYLTVLDRWSRSQIVYSQFETMAHIRATYRSPEFNRAYLQEYARIYHLSENERKKRGEIQTASIADFTEFIFYAYIPEKSSNDFARRDSIWTIFLIDNSGERIDPVEVKRIDPITPVTTEFFPYINPYHGNSYRLRFPPTKTGRGPQKLVFASVIAKVELEFGAR
ncbi:MAG: hypothetical protein ACYC5X_03135 [Syntrophales bacterium]